MKINSVGIVGYGNFGKFLVELASRFVPDVEVRVYSRRNDPDQKIFFTLKETSECDVVILCGSINEYENQLVSVLKHIRQESVLVDVATVKKYPTELFKKYAADRFWVSCHPMFGPESYKKTDGNVKGYRIVITDHRLAEIEYTWLCEKLVENGFTVIEMAAEKHDKLLAETLFLTHYIGQTISTAGIGRSDIDTVSFQSLMDAVESVIGDKKLFQDVYRFNPYCKEVAFRFHQAQEKVFKDLPN